MDNGLLVQVKRYILPDQIHYVEVTYAGMDVTCRVIEDRGKFTITRELFWTDKSKPRWSESVEKFKQLAILKYNRPIEERLSNANKTGTV